jgi:putative phosphoesterase
MRIAVISDIHSNNDALTAVLETIDDYDALICLGDLVGYGAEPNEVVETIRMMKPQVIVAGNHDYATVTGDTSDFVHHAIKAIEWTRKRLTMENMKYLSSLPHSSAFVANQVTLKAYHGSPRDPLNEYIYPGMPSFILKSLLEMAETNVLLLGHTHIAFDARIDTKLLINPGGVGQPRDGDPRASYAIIEIGGDRLSYAIKRVEYDIDSAASKILQNSLPSFLADRLYGGI